MTTFLSFKTLKRPSKPNTCLVAPQDHCLAAEPDFEPPATTHSAADLFDRFKSIVATQRSWSKVDADADQGRIRFVATTGLMRFKDDVDIEIIPLSDARATFAIYSRSRVGYSDLGTNRKRVEKLIDQVITN